MDRDAYSGSPMGAREKQRGPSGRSLTRSGTLNDGRLQQRRWASAVHEDELKRDKTLRTALERQQEKQ